MNHWSDIEKADNAAIIDWAADEPWARAMAACGQDPQSHAEGDVWTHTKMVCAELTRLDEWNSLSREEQLKLLFTALLHDVAKPTTTVINPKTGRMEAHRHTLNGEYMARRILLELETPLHIREEVTQMVRYHGRPVFLLSKSKMDPPGEVSSLSWLLNNQLLYLFALANYRGRICRKNIRKEESLEWWKSVSEKYNCFGKPFPFENNHARFLYFRGRLCLSFSAPREKYRCTVTVMSGLPGAGKDTWIRTEGTDRPMVSMDAIRRDLKIHPTDNQGQVGQATQAAVRGLLRESQSFIFNATNLTRRMRDRWIELFHNYKARVEIIYIEPPLSTLLQQNRERENSVPEEIIQAMIDKLEPPTWQEAHRVSYVTT